MSEESKAIALRLTAENAQEAKLTALEDGAYEIETTGTNAYVFTEAFASTPEPSVHRVLAFDYFCATGTDGFEVWCFPPEDPNRRAEGEGLGMSEGWVAYNLDLSAQTGVWDRPCEYFRLHFGHVAGRTIRIRNMVLRPPTERERQLAERQEAIRAEQEALDLALRSYLDTDFPCSVDAVRADAEKIHITGHVTESGLVLGESPLYEHLSALTSFERSIPIGVDNGLFEVAVDRYVDTPAGRYDRILSRWVVARESGAGVGLRSHARYADTIDGARNIPEARPRTKKGLGGFGVGRDSPVSDLDELGITSVTVNIWINDFMRSEPGENTIPFEYGGVTWYADGERMDYYDRTMRACSERNIVVSAILLVNKADESDDAKVGELLMHPDCDPAGIYSMPNVTSPEGLACYAAALDFLAERYSREDQRYGWIHNWIMHNEVDAGWVWTNAGEKTPLTFMDLYHKSMRAAHVITRKYNPNARTFITLTHYWNWTADKHFYHSKELLEILLELSRAEGDFDWGVAHHPYPESLFEPKSWQDTKVDFTFDTPLITFKNLEVIDAWIKRPDTFYLGKHQRPLHLSEQGPNSRDYSEQSLAEQAASMAYAWNKYKDLDGIEAFQFHNWVDSRGEGGLRIGLRRFPDDETDPAGAKPVWHVYKALDTPEEEAACAFAKEIIGIDDWEEVKYKGDIA